jgi:methylmalonyl-CoA mutase
MRLAELARFQNHNAEMSPMALGALQRSAVGDGNIFEVLMESAKVATLGQITDALYHVGGKYRRNM